MNQTQIFRRTLIAAALSSALVMTGCGGGGGNAIVTDPGDSTSSFGSIGGTAAKGIIQSGQVTAYELDANGNILRALGTTTTGADGKYSIDVSSDYTNGPIKVTVEATDASKMICDVNDSSVCTFGEPIDLPTDFSMDSVLPEAVAGESISAPITPLTHMAASRALATGNPVTADSVNAAVSEVNQLVGVNILEVEPVDITDPSALAAADDAQQTYAAFSAGIGLLTLKTTGGITAGLADLAKSFEDGKLESTESITITEIVNAVREEAADSGLDVADQISSIEARVGEDGSFDPEPLDGAATDIAKGKALLSDVRTWLTSFNNFEQPLDAFAGDVELASELFDVEAEAHAELFTSVMDTVVEFIDAAETQVGSHSVPFTPTGSQTTTTVPVTVATTGSNNGLTVTVTETIIQGLEKEVSVIFVLNTNLPEAALADSPFQLSELDVSVTGSVSSNTSGISLQNTSLSYEAVEAVEVGGEVEVEPVTKAVSLSGGLLITRTIANSDGTATQYQFEGTATLAGTKLNTISAEADNDISLSSVRLDGEISASDGRELSATASLTIDNAASFDTVGFMNHDSYVNMMRNFDGDPLTIHANEANLASANNDGYYNIEYNSFSNQTCYQANSLTNDPSNPHCVVGDTLGVKNQLLAVMTSEYPGAELEHVTMMFSYSGGPASTAYSAGARLPDFETAESYLKATVGVTTELNLPNLPNSSIALNASRTGEEIGAASAAIIQGNVERFKIAGSISGEDVLGNVVFKNADGVALTVTPNATETAGVVSVDGATVGTLTDRDGTPLIIWADGSFESIN